MLLPHLKNPFENFRISKGNYETMCSIHLERLKKDNDAGQWSAMIAATEPLLENFTASIVGNKKEKSISEGKTVAVDLYSAQIKEYIQRKEGVIADKFPVTSGEYQEFFPLGLTEYTRAAKKNIEPIVERLINAMKRFEAEFGITMWKDLEQLLEKYKSARSLQLRFIGGAKTSANDSKQNRKLLAEQMFINMLELLQHFVQNTERVLNYFDTSMFKTARKKMEGEGAK